MRIRHVKAFGPFAARRPRSYRGFGYFGSPSQYQSNVDCPVGGSWEAWCACVYAPGSDALARCVSKPLGPAMFTAPWTEIGAGARGLQHAGTFAPITSAVLNIVSPLTAGVIQAVPGAPVTLPPVSSGVQTGSTTIDIKTTGGLADKPADEGIFGIPKQAALVGGAVLAVGALALAFSGRRR